METEIQHTSDEPRKLSYKLLKQITNHFNAERIIGSGTFGTVYKGVYENGEEIAVKILRNTLEFDGKEFRKEFRNLRGLKHQNIVELVGFCDESKQVVAKFEGNLVIATQMHRALCFEYIHNGSLQNHITAQDKGLNWHERYKIIKGICDGLKYLREGLEFPVMHLDLKPDNILLDKKMVPKIADFGLSRLFGEANTRTISSIGTIGYLPPEYINHQVISEHFDIYSLGVIITRIMIGHEGYNRIDEMPSENFIAHVHDNWRDRLTEMLNPTQLEANCQQVKRCIEIALECMKETRHERPTIQNIVSSLIDTESMIGELKFQIEQFCGGESILSEGVTPEVVQEKVILEEVKEEVISEGVIMETVQEKVIPEGVQGKVILEGLSLEKEKKNASGGMPAGTPPIPENGKKNASGDESKGIKLSVHLPFHFLKEITDGFSSKRILSEGALGTLYKGIIEDYVIAVKKLTDNMPVPRDTVFTREVQNIMALTHDNIVRLTNFCHEQRREVLQNNGKYIVVDVAESLLCYEYLPKGSLDNYIFGRPHNIDWATRFKIIEGICSGLRFLRRIPIVHMDLKPENILLDNEMVPKIANFGLSRIFGQEQTQLHTQKVVGSYGYMAPEYLYRGAITTETDIYSLGVVIIEITTGEKNNSAKENEPTAAKFIEKIRKKWTQEHIASAYKNLSSTVLLQVKTCIDIGFDCAQRDRNRRPSLEIIVDKFGAIQELIRYHQSTPSLWNGN